MQKWPKPKKYAKSFKEEKKGVSCKLEHISLRHQVQSDMDFYTSTINCQDLKAEEALSNQLQRVNQIQEFHDQNDDEEKKWHTIMKLQEIEQQTKTWKSEIHQLNQASSQLL